MRASCWYTRALWPALFIGLWAMTPVWGETRENKESRGVVQIEPVTVTASKRDANAQEAAIPMSIVTDVQIEDQSIDSLKDFSAFLPNFIYGGNRLDSGSFSYRGLGYNTFTEKEPVIVNVDGVPWDSRFGILTGFIDIEQVEFLRGPQGTLYGKNAMGGVINITTKQPGDAIHGKVSVNVEENNGYGTKFVVSGPADVDHLFFSLAGAYSTTDGYMTDHTPGGDRDWDHNEKKYLSVKLGYEPSQTLDMSLSYRFNSSDGGHSPIYMGDRFTYDTYNGYKDPKMEQNTHDASFKIDLSTRLFDITAITGFKHTAADAKIAYQPSDYGCPMDVTEGGLSQEIRFKSKDKKEGLQWLFGLYADSSKLDNAITMEYDYSDYGLGVLSDTYAFEIPTKSYAAFGEMTIPLFTPSLALTLGARLERVEKEMDYRHDQADWATGASSGTYNWIYMTDNPTQYTVEDSWRAFLGKMALAYRVNGGFMPYLSISQGYMPGGFNYTNDIKENAQFDEQRSLDYELGFKSMLFDRRLMFNVNLFYTLYKDMQILQNKAGTLVYYVNNAGEAHATGIEADFNAQITRNLNLFGSLGVMEAEYDDYGVETYSGTIDYDGNTMTYAPSYSVSIGAVYRHKTGLFIYGCYHRYGETQFSEDNNSRYERGAYDLVDAKIGYESSMGWEVYVYARNLLNEAYITEAFAGAYDIFAVGEPRTVGLELVYRF
nr:TonB-dependent receptor [uncultured Desulfobacter sp.]